MTSALFFVFSIALFFGGWRMRKDAKQSIIKFNPLLSKRDDGGLLAWIELLAGWVLVVLSVPLFLVSLSIF